MPDHVGREAGGGVSDLYRVQLAEACRNVITHLGT
ncbi:hypothetical protein BX286_0249 [Streptomyces sp. 3211.6]|nr:hypothetical protein BX286_0249 [Streptomyces sp. 3211.6]